MLAAELGSEELAMLGPARAEIARLVPELDEGRPLPALTMVPLGSRS